MQPVVHTILTPHILDDPHESGNIVEEYEYSNTLPDVQFEVTNICKQEMLSHRICSALFFM
jgi:hypothetical protein